eukprot:972114-Pleurochrysis_carterae.AAC.4
MAQGPVHISTACPPTLLRATADPAPFGSSRLAVHKPKSRTCLDDELEGTAVILHPRGEH